MTDKPRNALVELQNMGMFPGMNNLLQSKNFGRGEDGEFDINVAQHQIREVLSKARGGDRFFQQNGIDWGVVARTMARNGNTDALVAITIERPGDDSTAFLKGVRHAAVMGEQKAPVSYVVDALAQRQAEATRADAAEQTVAARDATIAELREQLAAEAARADTAEAALGTANAEIEHLETVNISLTDRLSTMESRLAALEEKSVPAAPAADQAEPQAAPVRLKFEWWGLSRKAKAANEAAVLAALEQQGAYLMADGMDVDAVFDLFDAPDNQINRILNRLEEERLIQVTKAGDGGYHFAVADNRLQSPSTFMRTTPAAAAPAPAARANTKPAAVPTGPAHADGPFAAATGTGAATPAAAPDLDYLDIPDFLRRQAEAGAAPATT